MSPVNIKVPHSLGTTGRVANISPKQAEIRNRSRLDLGESNLWEIIPPPADTPLPEETLLGEGVISQKDGAIVAKKIEKKKVVKSAKVAGKPRPKWNGHSMVQMARLCGSLNYSYGKTCAVLDELGLEHSTVRTNHYYGKKRTHPLPELSGKELKEVKSVAAGITDEQAAKAQRKADEKSGDKSPKNPRAAKAKEEKPKVSAKKKVVDDTEEEAPPKKKKFKKPKATPVVDDTEEASEPEEETEDATEIADDTETADEEAEELVEA